jgi:hypothetical protein
MARIRKIFKGLVAAWERYHIAYIIAGLLVVCVVFIGTRDRGMILGYIATTLIMVEITRRWRKILYFFLFGLTAFLSSIFLSFLHEEIVKPLIRILLGAGALNSLGFHLFHDAVTFYILFFGLMGVVIGALGMAALAVYRLISLITRDKSASRT